jgi:hypothetical protein
MKNEERSNGLSQERQEQRRRQPQQPRVKRQPGKSREETQVLAKEEQQEKELQEDISPLQGTQLDCWDWESLSQWIPPSALFQASLHHQAFLELSDISPPAYPSLKTPRHEGKKQQQTQVQLPNLPPSRHSKHSSSRKTVRV